MQFVAPSSTVRCGVHLVLLLCCVLPAAGAGTELHIQEAQLQQRVKAKEAPLLRRKSKLGSARVLLQERKSPPPAFSFPNTEDDTEDDDIIVSMATTTTVDAKTTPAPTSEAPTTPSAEQETAATMAVDVDKDAPKTDAVKVLYDPPVPPEITVTMSPDVDTDAPKKYPVQVPFDPQVPPEEITVTMVPDTDKENGKKMLNEPSIVYSDPFLQLKQALTALEWLENDLRKKYDAMDEKVYMEKIERDEAKVAAETSVGTAKMLGKMRRDMHKFAAPFYRKALLEEIREVVGRKEEVLAKLEGRESPASTQATSTTAAPVLETKEEEEKEQEGKLKYLIVPIVATTIALIILLFCCFSRRRRRPEDEVRNRGPVLQRGVMHGPGASALARDE